MIFRQMDLIVIRCFVFLGKTRLVQIVFGSVLSGFGVLLLIQSIYLLIDQQKLITQHVNVMAHVIATRQNGGRHPSFQIQYKFSLDDMKIFLGQTERGPIPNDNKWVSLPQSDWETCCKQQIVSVEYYPPDPHLNDLTLNVRDGLERQWLHLAMAAAFTLGWVAWLTVQIIYLSRSKLNRVRTA